MAQSLELFKTTRQNTADGKVFRSGINILASTLLGVALRTATYAYTAGNDNQYEYAIGTYVR